MPWPKIPSSESDVITPKWIASKKMQFSVAPRLNILANVGHMPPYLNGQAVATEDALPLGVFAGAEPSVMHFTLEHEDRLVLTPI
jgi:hypothetical protein